MSNPLSTCELCPRRCGADRLAGETGYCRAGALPEVYRYGPHHGEEPPLSGTRGSGTVFFSRCTLRCVYCQNHPWSQGGQGETMVAGRLAGVFRDLAADGCHNWNLVSPTPWLPQIAAALELARADGHALPVVYNTSGFERVETLARYADLADVYLADLRYACDASAAEGSGHGEYVRVARAALQEMWRQVGPLEVDRDGLARCGTMCRILILPGRAREAVESLEWLHVAFGPGLAVSVMAQYLPAHRAAGMPSWDRGITVREYETVVAAVERLGFETGWIQEYGGAVPRDLVGYEMAAGPASPM